jgi:hypothetical protein
MASVYWLCAAAATSVPYLAGPVLDFSASQRSSSKNMRPKFWTNFLAAGFLLVGHAHAQEYGETDPLFRSSDVLNVTITAPLRTLMKVRPTEEDLPGQLTYVDEAGATVEMNIGLRTRGNYRRQMRVCPFAPIRLNFKKSETKNTVFHKQDKIKLVGHCKDNSNRFEQVALKEYLVYRFLNEMTDLSFRVRLLHITYVDSDRSGKEQKRYGFLIEHKDRLAKRVGLPNIEIPRTRVAALVGDYTNLTSLFQFFIANTDFSSISAEPDDSCCHNSRLFGYQAQLYYSIPYDFDMAGMTDAPYATPSRVFRIPNVRRRLYRGRCANNQHLPASVQMFMDNKDALYALVEDMQALNGPSKSRMYSLMNSFYRLIENPKAVEKKIVRRCI